MAQQGLECRACASEYESIQGIPDLRLPGYGKLDHEADRLQARRLLAEAPRLSTEELVRRVFSDRPDKYTESIDWRIRRVMTSPDRLRADVKGWLAPCVASDGPFLDLGCGAGMLLAAAAAEGHNGIGIDSSMVWLVVAQRLIAEWALST